MAVSSYSSTSTGDFTVSFTGPADANIIYLGPNIYDENCTFVGCFSDNDHYNFPGLVYDDNCTVSVDSVDEVFPGLLCGTKIVRRTYTVTDAAGMTATCTKEFYFTGVDMSNFSWPKNWDDVPGNNPMLLCDEVYPLDKNGHPHPSYTGYPDGYDESCGTIEVFYNDVVYGMEDGVPCGWKIFRYWTVHDDCTGITEEDIQLIRITDKTAPTFMAPAAAVTISTGAYVCEGTYKVPGLEHLEDNCNNGAYYYVTASQGKVVQNFDGSWVVTNLPLGTTDVCYVVYDACQNKDTACVAVTVEDLVPPIAVCEQYKQVSLTVDGTAVVCAPDVDSGSLDNCNDVSFKVRRGMSGSFTDCVSFDCNDAGNVVMVTLRVYDQILPLGDVSASAYEGHYNDCMSNIEVLCKLPPVLTCENITVDCEAVLDPEQDPSLYPEVQAVCLDSMWYEDEEKLGGNVCEPVRTRTWYASGCGQVKQCSQKITLVGDAPFDPCTIQMPDDQTGMCSDPSAGSEPVYDEGPCNVVTHKALKRDTFKFVEGACYKVLVEWVVIDWCIYDKLTPAQQVAAREDIDVWKSNRKLDCKDSHYAGGFDGYYRYTQTLMMVDNWAPEITVKDTCIGTVNCAASPVKLTASATDTCNPTEEFHWKYLIMNMDTWEIVQYSDDYVPEYGPANVGGGDLDNVVEATIELENPLPVGTYKVEWVVGDGCGNATKEVQIVKVQDLKAPTPIMVDIATAVMTDGTVDLRARTFDKGGCGNGCISSFDNCSPKESLSFTFGAHLPHVWEGWGLPDSHGLYYFDPNTGSKKNRSAFVKGTADAWDPIGRTAIRRYHCDSVVAGVNAQVNQDVYVWDGFGPYEGVSCGGVNYDFATVVLSFNNCAGGIDGYVTLGGLASLVETNEGVENIKMTTMINSEVTGHSLTDGNGSFEFSLAPGEYTVYGSSDEDVLNGVSTIDLVLIQKHILGIGNGFTKAHDLLAADANNDGRVTAADIAVIRKVILGVRQDFKNNSWVAISSETGERELNVTLTEDTNVNFDVVKIGDLNNTAGNVIESRSGDIVSLELDNAVLSEGEVVEVPVYASNFGDVRGGQFAVSINGLNVEAVKSGKLNLDASNYNVKDNNLLVSWSEVEGQDVADGEVLFTLVLKSTSEVSLRSALRMNDSKLRSEAYKGSDLEISDISLSYRNASYALYQNTPNPFVSETTIGFELPEASEYTLTVYDVTGKLVKVITAEGEAGYNAQTISKKDLDVSGVLYYRLESGDYTATKKMVILK